MAAISPEDPNHERTRHLVAVIAYPDCEPVVRRAKIIADAERLEWIALYSDEEIEDAEVSRVLAANLELARELGATVVASRGDGLLEECLEHTGAVFVVGWRKRKGGRVDSADSRLVNRLMRRGADIRTVTHQMGPGKSRCRGGVRFGLGIRSGSWLAIAAGSLITAILCEQMIDAGLPGYLPMTLLLLFFMGAIMLKMKYAVLYTLIAILIVDLTFIMPVYSLQINSRSDVIAFLIFFVIAMFNGILATLYNRWRRRALEGGRQAEALLMLTRKLNQTEDLQQAVRVSEESIKNEFSVGVALLFQDEGKPLTESPQLPRDAVLSPVDKDAVNWAFMHQKPTGRFTDTFPSADYTYYPLRGPRYRLGVVAVGQRKAFTGRTAVFWDAVVEQIGRSLEQRRVEDISRESTLSDQSDKLYHALFGTLTFELNAPVSAIEQTAGQLLADPDADAVQKRLSADILTASQKLDRMIGTLMDMWRIETGRVMPRREWCDIRQLAGEVRESLEKELAAYDYRADIPAMPRVRIDPRLTGQALRNLLHNSCLYTPPGTVIGLEACLEEGKLILKQTDDGPGFEPQSLVRVFDKFWRPEDALPGGMGLGLPVVKGFVEAQGGSVAVENKPGGGVCFTLSIPVEVERKGGRGPGQ